jgi:hypothetical protein
MVNRRCVVIAIAALVVVALLLPSDASAHNVSKRDATFVKSITGRAIVPFLYLGAKHMVTGRIRTAPGSSWERRDPFLTFASVLSEPRRPWQDSFGISFGRTF